MVWALALAPAGAGPLPQAAEVAEAMVNKGTALYYLKRYYEARKAFEEAAKLGHPQARQALEILREEGH